MVLEAFASGIVSAVSLVVGAVLGIWLRPRQEITAAVMSFGAGALLAALTFELIEPAYAHGGIVPLAIGTLVGAGVFVAINAALDSAGGFMRKGATAAVFLSRGSRAEVERILDGLSGVGLLRALSPAEVGALAQVIDPILVTRGTRLLAQGEAGDAVYVVVSGQLEVRRGAERVASLGRGEVVGEMAVVTGEARTATVVAQSDSELLRIGKEDFERLLGTSPEVAKEVSRLLAQRLAAASAHHGGASASGGAAIGIYIGLFLDAVPESLAIGALMVGGAAFNLPFIVALFLSNLPEAMSSSVIMRRIGYGRLRIILMWSGLMLFTGVGAVAGNLLFAGASPVVLAVVFALAAGAMLAMLAQTAMPEAYAQGRWVVGLTTVLGFLAAYSMKTIGEH